ncbi:hypothetical protein [Enterocloster sp.]|uniref:hypothetical protein n=1 Tax=Enterocloster sp. TaxID=2719315 RepID=UPI0039A1E549
MLSGLPTAPPVDAQLKAASPYADRVASKVEMIVVAAAMMKTVPETDADRHLPLINNCDMYPSSSIFSGKSWDFEKISFDDLKSNYHQ